MSLNNTYSAFYEMSIKDYRIEQGVYSVRFYLIAKRNYANSIREWLHAHFTEFSESEDTVVLINTFDITDMRGNEIDDYICGVYEG